MNPISQTDPELWQAICDETRRQETTLELIASENHALLTVFCCCRHAAYAISTRKGIPASDTMAAASSLM